MENPNALLKKIAFGIQIIFPDIANILFSLVENGLIVR
jgi:hypothetical protein